MRFRVISYIPALFKLLSIQLGLVFLLLFLTRWVFLAFNHSHFQDWTMYEMIVGGSRFDLATIGMMYIPLTALIASPLPWSTTKWGRWTLRGYFWLVSSFVLLGNLADTGFFQHSLRRSTAEILDIISTGSDFARMLPIYLMENWYLLIIIIVLFTLADWVYRILTKKVSVELDLLTNKVLISIAMLVIGGLLVLLGRGGFGVRAISIMSAAEDAPPQRMALVLNTPFCILKTLGQPVLEKVEVFSSQEELQAVVNPLHPPSSHNTGRNVVVIVLESVSHEYSGLMRNLPQTHVPVLDSIMEQSLYFTHCYANAKRSIEGIPAIVSSLPAFMERPLTSSPYAGNEIQSIPSVLDGSGYKSTFYHGASFGSMAFNQFTASAGFDDYLAKENYPDPAHDDGRWGIYDEYFLPWSAEKMASNGSPFFSLVFSLASHHPYSVPLHHGEKFGPEGEILTGVHYVDFALGLFFEKAKQQDWYENTVFVITADHTPASTAKYYKTRAGMFRIPLVIFDPSGSLPRGRRDDACQQLDIMPTILGITGNTEGYFSLGRDLLDHNAMDNAGATAYMAGIFQIMNDSLLLQYDGENPLRMFEYRKDSTLWNDIMDDHPEATQKMLLRGQAYRQWYNNGMIDNKLTYGAYMGDNQP